MMTNDGMVLRGQTPEAIVDELHRNSFSPCQSRHQFMEEVASRTLLQTGSRVRTTSPRAFIEDLQAAGILLPEAEEQL